MQIIAFFGAIVSGYEADRLREAELSRRESRKATSADYTPSASHPPPPPSRKRDRFVVELEAKRSDRSIGERMRSLL